jgi:CubicO group peptidase (beta-lactamase class C family)
VSISGAARLTVGGAVALELTGGTANDETGELCTAATRFQVSSVSKRFVAASALLLVERGQLDLHEPIARWLPHTSAEWRAITMHHLLSHTSGLGHWADVPGFDLAHPLAAAHLIELVAGHPLLNVPGDTWRYSGPGYVLAAHLVATIAGVSYHEFVAEEIFGRLGMTSSTSGVNPVGEGVALGHRHSGETGIVAGFEKLPGTGDVWSTVADLELFTRSLHTGGLLTDASVASMVTVQAPFEAPDQQASADDPVVSDGYGYGHYIGRIQASGEPVWFHPGDNPGYVSWLGWCPVQHAVIVVLGNDERHAVDDVVAECLRHLPA